jgi:hypothetical protein
MHNLFDCGMVTLKILVFRCTFFFVEQSAVLGHGASKAKLICDDKKNSKLGKKGEIAVITVIIIVNHEKREKER